MLESLCAFKPFRVCLMELCALTLGRQVDNCYFLFFFFFVFLCISIFISRKFPSLSHLINISLKSTLSDISIGTPAYFRGPLAC
jgi:hypothetical protein